MQVRRTVMRISSIISFALVLETVAVWFLMG